MFVYSFLSECVVNLSVQSSTKASFLDIDDNEFQTKQT